MKILLIHNPTAGLKPVPKKRLIRALHDAGHDVDYSEDPASARKLQGTDVQAVVVAGGDGTFINTAMHLVGGNVPLVFLPIGTANNIGKALGLNGSTDEVIATLRSPLARDFDIGMASGAWGQRLFFEGAGVGFLSQAMDRKLGSESKHPSRALRAFRTALEEYQPRQWHVTIDGEAYDGEYVLIEVLNVPSVGPNLYLAPKADHGDGLFDVVMLTARQKRSLLEAIDERLDDEKKNEARISPRAIRGHHVRIELGGAKTRIDGVIRPKGKAESKYVDFHCLASALRLWLPPGT